jgi:hypothetical protein
MAGETQQSGFGAARYNLERSGKLELESAWERQLSLRQRRPSEQWRGFGLIGQAHPMGESNKAKKIALAQASEEAMVAGHEGWSQ